MIFATSDEMRSYGIVVDVVAPGFERLGVKNASLVKAFLPDWGGETQLLSRPKRKTAFHKLQRTFDRHARTDGEKEVEMIWHHHEGMQPKLSSSAIVTTNRLAEPIALQKISASQDA
jgi:hypothetical protein